MTISLAREFLANLEVEYATKSNKMATEERIRFKLGTEAYVISIFDVCDVSGFAKNGGVKFPKFKEAFKFWEIIEVRKIFIEHGLVQETTYLYSEKIFQNRLINYIRSVNVRSLRI